MNISLTPIPTVPNSPLPNSSSAETAFVNNYMKLSHTGPLSNRERKAISILGLIHELKIVRGIDYTNNHDRLNQDAQVFTGAISMMDLDTAFAVVDLSNGQTADPTMATQLDALRAEARRLVERSEDELNRIMVLLELQLAE